MDETLVTEYLSRIGATRPAGPDLAGLRHLQERQVMTVPFENLDYHLGEPIHMDEQVLEKIVHRRRGGGCYETNPALSYLLTALGYQVDILPGQVFRPDRLGAPLCHLALRVEVAGERWLVDTGFGRNSRLPLLFDSREPQQDPHGEYTIVDWDNGIEVRLNGRPLYRLDDRPSRVEDFAPTLWWWRTCPDSPFMQDLFCSLPTSDGRVTLKGDELTIVGGGQKTVEVLSDDAAVLGAYKKHFGFGLDVVPHKPQVDSAGIEV